MPFCNLFMGRPSYIYRSVVCSVLYQPVLGKLVRRPAILDKSLINELMNCYRPEHDDFDVIAATTMCALDFYEGLVSLVISVLTVCCCRTFYA